MNLGQLNVALRMTTNGLTSGVRAANSGLRSIGDAAVRVNQSVELAARTFGAFKAVGGDLLGTAMRAEALERAFKQITGSSEGAREELAWLRGESERLGLEFESVSGAYKGIAAAAKDTVLEGQGVRDIFSAISEGAAVLGLSADNTAGVLYALQQMISKGKVSSEELTQQMGERLPGALKLAVQAMGVTEDSFLKMLEQGQVMANDFLPKFAKVMHEEFGGAALEAAQSAQANLNRFKNAWLDLRIQMSNSGFLEAASGAFVSLTAKLKEPDTQERVQALAASFGRLAQSMADDAVPAIEKLVGVFDDLSRVWSSIPAEIRPMLVGAAIGGKLGGLPGAAVGTAVGVAKSADNARAALTELERLAKDIEKQEKNVESADSASRLLPDDKDLKARLAYEQAILDALRNRREELKLVLALEHSAGRAVASAAQPAATAAAPTRKKKPVVDEVPIKTQEAIDKLRAMAQEAQAAFDKVGLSDYEQGLIDIGLEMDQLREKYAEQMKGPGGEQVKRLLADYESWRKSTLKKAEADKRATEEAQKLSAVQEGLNATVRDLDMAIATANLPAWQQQMAAVRDRIAEAGLSAADFAEQLAGAEERYKALARINAEQDLARIRDEQSTRGMQSDLAALADTARQYRQAMAEVAFDPKLVQQYTDALGVAAQNAQKDIASGSLTFEGWTMGIDAFNRDLDAMVVKLGLVGHAAEEFKAGMREAFNMSMIATEFKSTLDSMAGPMADFFAQYAKTGKASLKDLAAALVANLQMVAAEKTARLLMEAAYHGAMVFIDPNNLTNNGVPHSQSAARALQGAALMGSFIAGSGLVGMAHDGIREVPREGTWLLQKGERVLDANTTRAMDKAFEGGGFGGGPTLTFHNTWAPGTTEEDARRVARANAAEIKRVIASDARRGGSASRAIRSYS